MVNILGIKFETARRALIFKKIEDFLNSQTNHYITTVNPEITLKAIKGDEEYFYILNQADLSLADGVGLKFASWLIGHHLTRITGADLVPWLLEIATKNNYRVLIINWRLGLSNAQDIERVIKNKYPKIQLLIIETNRQTDLNNTDLKIIDDFKPQIMLVSLGAPWQEKFIWHNYQKINSLRIAVGIGGALDFLTNKISRAPKLLQNLGLEWLYRLKKQPRKRLKRIFQATIIFPWEVIKWRFIHPWQYRPNVACWLYKKVGADYYVLLVERVDEPEHWQLPQGGTDGLSLETAGAKELREEINISQFKVQATYPNLYKYKIPSQKHVGYKGQRQGLMIAEYQGRDEDIKTNFWDHSRWQWVKTTEFINAVHPVRQPSAKIFLQKFNEYLKSYE